MNPKTVVKKKNTKKQALSNHKNKSKTLRISNCRWGEKTAAGDNPKATFNLPVWLPARALEWKQESPAMNIWSAQHWHNSPPFEINVNFATDFSGSRAPIWNTSEKLSLFVVERDGPLWDLWEAGSLRKAPYLPEFLSVQEEDIHLFTLWVCARMVGHLS